MEYHKCCTPKKCTSFSVVAWYTTNVNLFERFIQSAYENTSPYIKRKLMCFDYIRDSKYSITARYIYFNIDIIWALLGRCNHFIEMVYNDMFMMRIICRVKFDLTKSISVWQHAIFIWLIWILGNIVCRVIISIFQV